MMKFLRLFRIRQDERLPAALLLVWQFALQVVVITKYWNTFSKFDAGSFRRIVLNTFQISGFDPLTYLVISNWNQDYDITRHPLLAPFYYPVYLFNHALLSLTGINFAPVLVGFVLVFCSVYAFVFMLRTAREIIGVTQKEAAVLGFMLFSFAYVMLAAISPDHFILSLFWLMLTLYVSGRCIKEHRRLGILSTFLLFFFTAGISLNNGLKVFLGNFFANKRAFFRPMNLLFAIILPGLLFFYGARWLDHTYKDPERIARHKREALRTEREKKALFIAFKDTSTVKDTALLHQSFNKLWAEHQAQKQQKHDSKPMFAHSGKPIKKLPLLSWTDITTPRAPSVVENFFGQGLQLHQKHTLDDVLRDRPVFVSYSHWWNYAVEAVLVLLFACGIFAGRRQRLMWLAVCCFALDAILYLGLGFGINEVYIMTAGWAYVIPLCIGYLIVTLKGKARTAITALATAITLYLLVYNTTLFLINFL